MNHIKGINNSKFHANANSSRFLGKWEVNPNVEVMAFDTGACTSIGPPACFPNTPIKHTEDTGKKYGACGGNAVTNIGTKFITFTPDNNKIQKITMQTGDKITRSLLAGSDVTAAGNMVVLGPGPKFES